MSERKDVTMNPLVLDNVPPHSRCAADKTHLGITAKIELVERIKAAAQADNRSVSNYVALVLSQHLASRETKAA
jgi:hypothetical protein